VYLLLFLFTTVLTDLFKYDYCLLLLYYLINNNLSKDINNKKKVLPLVFFF